MRRQGDQTTYLVTGDAAVGLEHLAQVLLGELLAEVLHVQVLEVRGLLLLPVPPWYELDHMHLLVIAQHPVHLLDGRPSGLLRVEMHEPVAARVAILVLSDIAV